MAKLFLNLVVLFALSILTVSSELTYTVIKVYDGDTITVVNNSANSLTSIRVRFICIDAPEISQIPWGNLSLNSLK